MARFKAPDIQNLPNSTRSADVTIAHNAMALLAHNRESTERVFALETAGVTDSNSPWINRLLDWGFFEGPGPQIPDGVCFFSFSLNFPEGITPGVENAGKTADFDGFILGSRPKAMILRRFFRTSCDTLRKVSGLFRRNEDPSGVTT